MNQKTKSSFDHIQDAASAFQTSVAEALFRFRKADAQAKEDAEQYKDSETRYLAQRDELVNNARNSIETAKTHFSKIVKTEIEELRKELESHTMNRPSPALLDNLRTFKDFAIQPTHSDIAGLMEMAAGNTLALRAINSVLETTKSPLRIDFPAVEDFENDLTVLEKLTDERTFWTPIDFHHEACEVLGGQPRQNYPGYTWGNTSLTIARATYESQIKGLSDMSKRWAFDVIPSLAQVNLYEDTDDTSAVEQYLADRQSTGASAKVEPNKSEGVVYAKTLARQHTEADNRAREILSHFKK